MMPTAWPPPDSQPFVAESQTQEIHTRRVKMPLRLSKLLAAEFGEEKYTVEVS
jgi:hypothetical protein